MTAPTEAQKAKARELTGTDGDCIWIDQALWDEIAQALADEREAAIRECAQLLTNYLEAWSEAAEEADSINARWTVIRAHRDAILALLETAK